MHVYFYTPQDGILPQNELMDLYTFLFAENKPAIEFSAVERTARPEPVFVGMDLIVHFGEEDEELRGGSEFVQQIFGRIRLEVRCDVAPLASKFFLFLCNEDQKFVLRHSIICQLSELFVTTWNIFLHGLDYF